MEDLTLVGVHEDGEHLVLGGAAGQRFRIRVDDALRAAVRRDRARLGQLQIESEGGLRPREIQARIRSGQTAEEVAAAAGLPIEHVRRYEGPVLAEREFIAAQARGVRMRRSGAAGAPTLTLGELVTQRLSQREVDEQATEWDAWRDDDGSWVVCLTFTGGSKRRAAHWTYDQQSRHVLPRDDEARWFTDDEPEAGARRRLAPLQPARDGISDRVYDVEADGVVRPAQLDGVSEVRSATVDLLDTLRERRGRRQRISLGDDHEPEPDDELDTAMETLRSRAEALGNPPAAHPPRSRPELATDAELLELPDDDVIQLPEDEVIELPAEEPEPEPVPSRRQPSRGQSRIPEPAPAAQPAPARGGGQRTLERTAPPRTAPPRTAPPRSAPPRSAPSRKAQPRGGTRAEEPSAAEPAPAAARRPAPEPELEPEEAEQPADRSASSRRSRRASVPSWDDIVFGSRRE